MRTDRIKILLVFSIILTLLSGVITYFAVIESRKRVDFVLHSYAVLQKSKELLSMISTAESGVRGFMLTRDSAFLTTYTLAKEQANGLITNLKELSIDRPGQLNIIAQGIEPYVGYKIKQLGFVANLSYNFGIQSGVDYSYVRKDSLTINNLVTALDAFNKNEEMLLDERLATLNQTLSTQNKVRYFSFFLIGLTLVFAYITINEKQKKNTELINKMNKTNAILEQKVRERTVELDRKNTTVSELNTELQKSVEQLQLFYESLQLKNRKTEDALAEVRDLYDNAPCGYHSLDRTGKIVRMNKTELDWLNYTADEVIDKLDFTDVVTKESAVFFSRLYPEFKKSGILNNVEFELKRKDGSIMPIVLSATAIYDDVGNYLMSRSTVFDISRRKDLEQKITNVNDALIQLNVEKDHFLGIAAHDLKSPVNSVLGLIKLLKRDENLTESQLEYLSIIERSCIGMKSLVSNLLDINKIEQGGAALQKEEIEITDLLNTQKNIFSDLALQKGIILNFEDLTKNTSLLADKDALNRILENLISNAIKFSLSSTEVKLQVGATLKHVTFKITDQGPGINKSDLPKLFGKFQRLSARPTGGESSSGLGLSIVKELVELMKGKISVETKEQEGSTFIVEIPR
jgi:PAS domain S-box-containing protein